MLDLAKELQKTLHIYSDELPYMDSGTGMATRVLMARPEENIYALHFRADPGVKTPLHKHHQPVMGFTLRGMWGHDEQYLYRPGTFIFETPGVIHQFINGPEVTEAMFIGDIGVDIVDPDTLETVERVDGPTIVKYYMNLCDEQGITPHFLK